MVIFSGLKQEIFQIVPDTSEHTILHLFWPNPLKAQETPKKLKNCIFGQISNSSLIFCPLPLPILGLSFKFCYAPLSGHDRR